MNGRSAGRSALLGAWLAAGAAVAAPPAPQVEHVVVNAAVIGGPAGAKGCLEPAVVSLLQSHGAEVRWVRADASRAEAVPGAIAVQLDLSSSARAALTFRAPGGDPPLLRDVPLARGLDEAGCEAVAVVIDGAVLSLSAQPPLQPPPPVPAPAPALSTVSPLPDAAMGSSRVSVAAGYQLQVIGWPVVARQAAVDVGFRRSPGRGRVTVGAGYQLPFIVATDAGDVRCQGLSLRLGGAQATRGRHFWLASGVSISVEALYIQGRTGAASASGPLVVNGAIGLGAGRALLLTPRWGLQVTAGARVGPHQALTLTAFWDLPALPAPRLQGAQVGFTPWQIQPGLAVGATWL